MAAEENSAFRLRINTAWIQKAGTDAECKI